MLIGALVSGLVLLHSATNANRLTEEVVRETTSSITLFQDLEAARLAGSDYMEEGERDARDKFRSAAGRVNRGLKGLAYDDPEERRGLRQTECEWSAGVRQLRANPPGAVRPPMARRTRRTCSRST